MMSQLASGKATDIDGLDWIREDFVYNKDGNVTDRNVVGSDSSVAQTDYSYTNSGDSDIMASATGDGAFTLSSDLNGNTTKLPDRWNRLVNVLPGESVDDAIDNCVKRGRPYGNVKWIETITQKLGLEITLRPRGRPKKGT